MNSVVLSSRGQLVLPASVRRLMGLHAGDRIAVSLVEDGGAAVLRRQPTIDEICETTARFGRQDKEPLEDTRAFFESRPVSTP
ncbi:MAG: AbrB/MazE/SpoVT family DNA-binding domain-containing protein [Cellulomonadaceae bacterium]|jgi:AbrB family looped-hinge helix DNA binding protein|nr:AbrB/MazE/SpoVT family DNA-binding domain-containing protein [Cellulomonadaceae bacterium]